MGVNCERAPSAADLWRKITCNAQGRECTCVPNYQISIRSFITGLLQSWVHWPALEGEHTKDGLMHSPERFAAHEAFQRLDAEGELAYSKLVLSEERTLAQARQVC